MGLDDAPALGKPDPRLALTATCLPRRAACRNPLKLQRNAGKIVAEARNVETSNRPRQVGGRARFAKGLQFLGSIEVLRDSEAHDLRAGPEHFHQFFHIVRDLRLLALRIERAQLGNRVRIAIASGSQSRQDH